MVIDIGYWTRVLKNILFLIITLVVLCLMFKMAIFYMPFLIAIIISLLVEPIIKFFAKKTKCTRRTCAIIILLITLALIFGLVVWGSIILVTESSNLLQGSNVYIGNIYEKVQYYISKLEYSQNNLPSQIIDIIKNSTDKVISYGTNSISNILNKLLQTIGKVPIIGIYIFITILATYFICIDKIYILDQLEHHMPRTWFRKFGSHAKEIISSLGKYLKAELILIGISFFIVLIGLISFKFIGFNVQYPLLCAIGISFVDALPILGAGTVMLPWAIIAATNGNIKLGIGLFVLYVIIVVVRQLTEPKIVGNKIGIHPIFTLIAMYTGFKLMGIIGLFVGPIILIILKNIFATTIDNGIVKTIFNRN